MFAIKTFCFTSSSIFTLFSFCLKNKISLIKSIYYVYTENQIFDSGIILKILFEMEIAIIKYNYINNY